MHFKSSLRYVLAERLSLACKIDTSKAQSSRNALRARFSTSSGLAVTAPPEGGASAIAELGCENNAGARGLLFEQCKVTQPLREADLSCVMHTATHNDGLTFSAQGGEMKPINSSVDSKTLISLRACFHLCGAGIDFVKCLQPSLQIGQT